MAQDANDSMRTFGVVFKIQDGQLTLRKEFGEKPTYLQPESWTSKGRIMELGNPLDECIINFLMAAYKGPPSPIHQRLGCDFAVADDLIMVKHIIFYYKTSSTLWAGSVVARSPVVDSWRMAKISKDFIPSHPKSEKAWFYYWAVEYWMEIPVITDILPQAVNIVCREAKHFRFHQRALQEFVTRASKVYSSREIFAGDIARLHLAEAIAECPGVVGTHIFSIPLIED